MSEKDNIRAAGEYMEAMNAHDHARMSSYHAEGFQFMAPGMPGPGGEAAHRAYMEQNWTAFPDLTFQTTQTIADGDYVVENWIGTGTHDGPLAMPTGDSVPATGRTGTVPGSDTIEFKDGKMIRVDVYFDRMSLLANLGVVPGA
ncbi:MAG: ester cyclase [bacterium]